jgi:transposase
MTRKPYPSDVSDDEWALVTPYLALVRQDAPQREHPLREVFDALRYVLRNGIPWWRALPDDPPPWAAVCQQAQRRLRAGAFETLAHDPRALLRVAAGREPVPTAAVLDGRTLRSTPESGARAGYDGAKRKKGPKPHLAVDTLGHPLALHVTPPQQPTTAPKPDASRRPRRMDRGAIHRARAWRWPSPTRATRETGPPRPRASTGSR